jgi:hypothetical protein
MAKVSNFKERYNDLQPLAKLPEEIWVDRIRTWRDFVEKGEAVASFLVHRYKVNIEEKGEEEGAQEYDKKIRQLHPSLHDLLMEYFDHPLPWTRDRRR